MKTWLVISLFSLARPVLAQTTGPHFQFHVTCRAPERQLELWLNAIGHPQFGFRYEGVGTIAFRGGPAKTFQVEWDFVGKQPLRGVVHDADGLGSSLLEMAPQPAFTYEDRPVPVTVKSRDCSAYPCPSPLRYTAICRLLR